MELVMRLYDNYQWRKNYRELKEDIRMIKSQRSDTKKVINNSLKSQMSKKFILLFQV